MKVLLFFILWTACGIAMQSEQPEKSSEQESCERYIAMRLKAQHGVTLHEPERVVGQELSKKDEDSMLDIDYNTKLDEKEIVAVNIHGKWVYGWVQAKPDLSNGIGLGIVNWASPIGDIFRGQARNFSDAVKKLPDLDKLKVQKTQ